MVNEFIASFKKENELSYQEILHKGFSNADIEQLLSRGVIEKKNYETYKLLKHKTVADYVNLAKSVEKVNTYSALSYFKQAIQLEDNPYIYFRMLKVLIKQKNYEAVLNAVEKMLEYDKNHEFPNRAYVILMILKELTPVPQELIEQVKIGQLTNNETGYNYLTNEEYFSVIHKIEDGNYCLAYKDMQKLTAISDNKARYIHDVIRCLLEQVNIQKIEQMHAILAEDRKKYFKEIKELYKMFSTSLNCGDYKKALEIIKRISFLAQHVMPDNYWTDFYTKYQILLTEIINLLEENSSTQKDYPWDEMFIHWRGLALRRLIEEHDFKKAFEISKEYATNAFQVNCHRLLSQIEFLENELSTHVKELMNEKNSCSLKDYLVQQIPNQQILQRVYMHIAQEYYQGNNQDRGVYFLDKAQQLSIEKEPTLNLQNKNSSN